MSIVLNGTTGITTPDLASGPVAGTTANFSGNVTLGSSVLATPSGSAPIFACRAWVNFNGTGTVAIRASGNVSSITDNGVGDYTVNFTTAMPDANYAAISSVASFLSPNTYATAAAPLMTAASTYGTKSTTACRLSAANPGVDAFEVSVAIFR